MDKKRRYIIGIVAMVFCVICLIIVYAKLSPKSEAKGNKAYELEVNDGNKSIKYSGSTDAMYLSELMDELKQEDFTYEGSSEEFGTYITSVNGVNANEGEKTAWMIYVNGEYGMYGVDAQSVNDGDHFELRLEKYE
ncbi:MAG: DUF4430 domain-containing protein [Lachnospiraceae bacterium]|nr:DUF4430 domain-containing protein [Lachnospiraceae bacterium]